MLNRLFIVVPATTIWLVEPMDHVFMFANKLVDMRIRQHGYQADQALQGKIYVLKQNMHPHIEIKSDIQPGS